MNLKSILKGFWNVIDSFNHKYSTTPPHRSKHALDTDSHRTLFPCVNFTRKHEYQDVTNYFQRKFCGIYLKQGRHHQAPTTSTETHVLIFTDVSQKLDNIRRAPHILSKVFEYSWKTSLFDPYIHIDSLLCARLFRAFCLRFAPDIHNYHVGKIVRF